MPKFVIRTVPVIKLLKLRRKCLQPLQDVLLEWSVGVGDSESCSLRDWQTSYDGNICCNVYKQLFNGQNSIARLDANLNCMTMNTPVDGEESFVSQSPCFLVQR